MNQVIEKLLAVQGVDARILGIRAEIEEGPRRIAEEEKELALHQARYDQAARRAKEAMRLAERKNGELEEVDRKMRDLSLKQNTARSNKEYEAFKKEIAGHRADFEILEEEALQQWSIGDDLEKEAATELEKIKEVEARLEAKRREWEREAREFGLELDMLGSDRGEKAREVPATWLEIYERVIKNRGTPAVVEVVAQYCQGCQMSISVHDVTRAIMGSHVVQCKSCNRILYAETL